MTTTRSARPVHVGVLVLALAASLLALPGVAAANPSMCGTVITTNTTLQGPVGPCLGDGLVIGASNITLDLNGHAIFGTPGPQPEPTGAGVLNEGFTGVTITNGTITEFDGGVVIRNATSNTVSNLTILDNNGDSAGLLSEWGEGIGLWESDQNTIENNVVAGNGSFAGIGLYGNLVDDGSDNNIVQGNEVVANATGVIQDIGIRVEPFSSDNTIQGNTVTGSRLDGIALFFGAVNNDVVGNEITANGRDGVHVWWRPTPGQPSNPDHAAGANNTLVEGNRICGNGDHGVWVGSVDNTITGNQVGDLVDNPLSGCATHPTFDLKDANPDPPGCDNNTWSNNDYTSADPAHCIS